MTLISIRQAAAAGISLLRKPTWAYSMDHIRLDLDAGGFGPVAHFHSPMNPSLGYPEPKDMPIASGGLDPDAVAFVPYDGVLADDPGYQAQLKWWGQGKAGRGEQT